MKDLGWGSMTGIQQKGSPSGCGGAERPTRDVDTSRHEPRTRSWEASVGPMCEKEVAAQRGANRESGSESQEGPPTPSAWVPRDHVRPAPSFPVM